MYSCKLRPGSADIFYRWKDKQINCFDTLGMALQLSHKVLPSLKGQQI